MANKIQVTSIQTRKSEEKKFYKPSFNYSDYVKTNYMDTGKIFKKNVYVSADKLVKTIVMHYDSPESYAEFLSDNTQIQMVNDRSKYLNDNKIVLTICVQEYNLEEGVLSTNIKVTMEQKTVTLRENNKAELEEFIQDSNYSIQNIYNL